jgi:hypothetical protein
MSEPMALATGARAPGTPRAQVRPTQLLTIVVVVAITVTAGVLVFKTLGPNVRPASTPVGWSGVYGDDFALALPNDFDTTTAPADLDQLQIPGLQMAAAKQGADEQQGPDAAVLIVTQPGTAAALAASVVGKRQTLTRTSLASGEALTADASIDGASGRVWFLQRGDHAWAVLVVVHDGGPYRLDDLGAKISDSFEAV